MQGRFPRTIRLVSTMVFICLVCTSHSQLYNYCSSGVRLKIHENAKKDIGVREKTGRNDAPEISKWNRYVGVADKSSYCASWIVNKYHEEGCFLIPKTAWSPSLFPKDYRVMHAGKILPGKELNAMDPLGMYFQTKKRIAHAAMYFYTIGDHYRTYEANTSITAIDGSEEDRDATIGGGVTYKTRHKRAWYSAASYIR